MKSYKFVVIHNHRFGNTVYNVSMDEKLKERVFENFEESPELLAQLMELDYEPELGEDIDWYEVSTEPDFILTIQDLKNL